jgi:hypothetical protein
MKNCFRCQELKPINCFGDHPKSRDGLWGRCLACVAAVSKKNPSPKINPLAARWHGIMGRCYNSTNKSYADYGGRGITACERWRTKEHFISDILSSIGRPSAGMSLDRIDNSLGYAPGNVRWANSKQQRANRRPCRAYKISSANKSGFVGVYKSGARWVAIARNAGKSVRIGTYGTRGDAVAARARYMSIKNCQRMPS